MKSLIIILTLGLALCSCEKKKSSSPTSDVDGSVGGGQDSTTVSVSISETNTVITGTNSSVDGTEIIVGTDAITLGLVVTLSYSEGNNGQTRELSVEGNVDVSSPVTIVLPPVFSTNLSDEVIEASTFEFVSGGVTTVISGENLNINQGAISVTIESWGIIRMTVATDSNAPILAITSPDGDNDFINQGGSFNVTFSLVDAEGTAELNLYYRSSPSNCSGDPASQGWTKFTVTPLSVDDTNHSFNTSSLAGPYYICGHATDGTHDAYDVSGVLNIFAPVQGNLQAYLKMPNATDLDGASWDFDTDGEFLAVGVPLEQSTTTAIIHGSDLSSTNDLGTAVGAAYVFRRENNN